MNKVDLIEQIAITSKLTKKEATEIVETFFDIIEKSLMAGEDVKISGFGNICVKEKPARKGIDPNTHTEMVIPATKAFTFKPSKTLKAKLNGEEE